MIADEQVARQWLSVLELADALGKISEACRAPRHDPDLEVRPKTYRWAATDGLRSGC